MRVLLVPQPTRVNLQVATEADVGLLADFMRQLRTDDPMPASGDATEAASLSAMRQLLTDPALGRVWLIRCTATDGPDAPPAAAGYVALTFVHSLELGGRCAFVDELLVAAGFRDRGVGREAVRLVEQQAQALGVRTLLLEVSPDNRAAFRLYDRCGFVPRPYNVMYKRLTGRSLNEASPKRPRCLHRGSPGPPVPRILQFSGFSQDPVAPMSDQKATNITWHAGTVTRADRERLLSQKGVTVWLTGLSASGKSTIAVMLEQLLLRRGKLAYRLDGDNVRHGLNKNLGFSAADRAENIRRIGEVAKLFTDAGVIVIASFISPYRSDRDAVRENLGPGNFIEVYVHASVEAAEKRDPKGLYKKARAAVAAGKGLSFTGIDDPYEPPERPEVVIETETVSADRAAEQVFELPRGAWLPIGLGKLVRKMFIRVLVHLRAVSLLWFIGSIGFFIRYANG